MNNPFVKYLLRGVYCMREGEGSEGRDRDKESLVGVIVEGRWSVVGVEGPV